MKKYLYIILAGIFALVSCNKFLDELPDDRADLNTVDKIQSFLVSAYPTHLPNFIMEYSADNIMCNGRQYSAMPYQENLYRWETVEEISDNDTPRAIYNAMYGTVATANQALDALSQMESNVRTNALKAEALLCRAYGMYHLANVFCMAWNPEKADEYPGMPYPKTVGVSVEERGTLRELYENINKDIEEALPLLNDTYLAVPKYHFNTRAAYAFAARFNLYYHNNKKAVEYASKVIADNPDAQLRQMSAYTNLAGIDDICNSYMRDDANLMLCTAYSIMGRSFFYIWSNTLRYDHNREIVTNETFWAKMPWGSGSGSNTLIESRMMYGNNQSVYYPKMLEQFEVTDKVSQTGFPHIVDPVFTTDETLLVRAEAYARDKQYENALSDANAWIRSHCTPATGSAVRPVLTEDSVNEFMERLDEVPALIETAKQRGVKKPLHPQGFTVDAGSMTNILYLILQMRRIETFGQGLRFIDIKRYGIEFSHDLPDEDPIVFKAGDLRGAIQLPDEVIATGLQPNPREK